MQTERYTHTHTEMDLKDLHIFSMLGQKGAPQKETPQARKCETVEQHYLACKPVKGLSAILWRVARF